MSANKSDVDNHNVETKGSGRIWPDWYPALAVFRNSDTRKAAWQLINTLVPYCGLWYLMIRSIQLGYPYALTLILALPSAAFLVRIFILFHDCVHGSFFRRQGVNTFSGTFSGCWSSLPLTTGALLTFDTTRLTRILMRGDSATSGP